MRGDVRKREAYGTVRLIHSSLRSSVLHLTLRYAPSLVPRAGFSTSPHSLRPLATRILTLPRSLHSLPLLTLRGLRPSSLCSLVGPTEGTGPPHDRRGSTGASRFAHFTPRSFRVSLCSPRLSLATPSAAPSFLTPFVTHPGRFTRSPPSPPSHALRLSPLEAEPGVALGLRPRSRLRRVWRGE